MKRQEKDVCLSVGRRDAALHERDARERDARGTPGHAAMRSALATVDFGLSGTIFPKLSVPKLYLMESMHSK